MSGIQVPNREILEARRAAVRVSRHDGLCVTDTQNKTCWCMRSCCWFPASRLSSKGSPMGACICKYCPCESAQMDRPARMRLV